MKTALRPETGRHLRVLIVTLLAVSVVTACGTEAQTEQQTGGAAVVERDNDGLHGTLVEPPLQLANITLRDTNGSATRLADFAPGTATVLFFGFTNCDDVCPTVMADLATARRSLSADLAKRVAVVFVTVDPSRDTPAVLRAWLDQFDTETVGLSGPTPLVNEAERSLYADQSNRARADATAGPETDEHQHERDPDSSPKPEGDYEVNHSGSVYIFAPHGETVLYSGGTTPDQYAADLKRLLRGSR